MRASPRTVSLIGWSGTGKTHLAARLIAHFRNRGYHVGAVKKSGGPVQVDRAGSDSDQLRRSGAERTLLLGSNMSVLFSDAEEGEALLEYLQTAELIVCEGLPLPEGPVIEVIGRAALEQGLRRADADAFVLAAPELARLCPPGAPRFEADELSRLVDYLEEAWNARSP
jgi:molybdopterin-guanine dinucleotide biosynthesis protein B